MIPAFDLSRQHESIRSEIDAALARTIARGRFILDQEVADFESEFAAYCGASCCVGVGSGTEALHLALAACGVGDGDEVVTVSHTAVATVAAIETAGARPVFVDIDPCRYTLDPARLEAALSPRSRAIVPVHLYGCPADLSPILEIAGRRRLAVVEDCAQAHGARYRGKGVGAWGRAGAFSFYPTKNLGAMGDGGAIVTDDPELAERARLLRQYGWKERYVSSTRGFNSRLDELQAAVLRVKLRHLSAWNGERRRLARRYGEALAGSRLALPVEPADSTHAYHLYVVRTPLRDPLRQFLASREIGASVHYPVPVHLQPAYRGTAAGEGSLRASEAAAREVLSLPFFPELRDDECAAVCEAVAEWEASLPAT